MKKCPYCAEEIQDEAIKCKHCHEFLDECKRAQPPVLPDMSVFREPRLPWYYSTSFLLLMFLTMPPFVLPFVWMHPKYNLVIKLLITVAAVGFCWGAFIVFDRFIHQYDEVIKMFDELNP